MNVGLRERVYALDAAQNLMVVACANKAVALFDVRNPAQPIREMESPLRFQTRDVSVFLDGAMFVLASIEGRCFVRHSDARIDGQDHSGSFPFKCHRRDGENKGQQVFAVNVVKCNPTERYKEVFITAGSDGSFVNWHKSKKLRLDEPRSASKVPITAVSWAPTGVSFAYAHGYDWHQGAAGDNKAANPVSIHIHNCSKDELVPPRGGY